MSRIIWQKKGLDASSSCPHCGGGLIHEMGCPNHDLGQLVDRKTLPSGRTVDVWKTPDGKLHEKTTGRLTAYGKKWEKEILPAIQKNAREATKRIKKRFGEHGEHFDPEIRRTAEGVIEWLLSTDQRSLPPKVLHAEVNAALDYLEAWKLRTDFLEETLRECSRIGHEYCCMVPAEIADKIDYTVEQVLGKADTWPAREKELRRGRVPLKTPISGGLHPDPPPRYDEVFAKGVEWLDSLDKPVEMLKLPPEKVKKGKALIRKMVKRDKKLKVLCTMPSTSLAPTSTKRAFLQTDTKKRS